MAERFDWRQHLVKIPVLLGALFAGISLDRYAKLRLRCKNNWQRFNRWLYSGSDTGRNAWTVSGFVTFFVFTLFLVLFYRRYDYIDDPPIRDSIRANVALLFSANLLRDSLHFLYQSIPSLPWYGIALYASMVGTFTVIFYLVLTRPMPWNARIVYFVLLVSMYIPFWVRASYNYAASLPGGIAFIAFYDSWRNKKKLSIRRSLLWGLLLLISFIFRRDGVKIGLGFIAPPVLAFLAFQVMIKKPKFKQILFYATCCLAFFLPYMLIRIFDEYQYQTVLTKQEQLHRTTNRSRSAYYGQSQMLTAMLNNQPFLKANGWDKNDVMIAEYGMVLFDENKYAAERFYRIFDPETGISQSEIHQGIFGLIYHLTHFGQEKNFIWYNPGWIEWNERWEYSPYYAAMITLTLFIFWRGKRYYDKLFGLGFLVYIYFISTYMLNYIRLPRHIAVPPLVLFCIAMGICPSLDFSNLTRGWYRKGLLTLVGLGLVSSLIGFIRLNYYSDQEIPIKRDKFLNLYRDFEQRFGSDAFIFIRPPLYIDYFVDPLGDQGPPNQLSSMNVSSTAYSPVYYQFLESRGLDYGYQLLPWMVDNPKAYLAGVQPVVIEWIKQFMYETFAIEAEMEPVYTYPDGLVIYQIVSTNRFASSFIPTTDLVDDLNKAQVFAPDPAYIHSGMLTIDHRSREILFQHPPSQIHYDVNVPPAGRFNFGIAIVSEAWDTSAPVGDGTTFRIYVEKNNQRELVFEKYIDPKKNPEDRHWLDFTVKLERWTGQNIHLILETDPGKNNNNLNDWAVWAEPTLGEWSNYSFTQKFYLGFPAPEWLDLLQVRRIMVGNSYRDAIFEHPDQEIHFPVTIEPNSRLDFQIGLDPSAWNAGKGDGVEFRLLVSENEGEYKELFVKFVEPNKNGNHSNWLDESVDLSNYAGKKVEIVFATSAGPNGDSSFDWAYWVSPRLVRKSTSH